MAYTSPWAQRKISAYNQTNRSPAGGGNSLWANTDIGQGAPAIQANNPNIRGSVNAYDGAVNGVMPTNGPANAMNPSKPGMFDGFQGPSMKTMMGGMQLAGGAMNLVSGFQGLKNSKAQMGMMKQQHATNMADRNRRIKKEDATAAIRF